MTFINVQGYQHICKFLTLTDSGSHSLDIKKIYMINLISVPHYHVMSKGCKFGFLTSILAWARAILLEDVYRRICNHIILQLSCRAQLTRPCSINVFKHR